MSRKNAGQRRIHLCAHGGECAAFCGTEVFAASLSCEGAEGIVCQKCQKAFARACALGKVKPGPAPEAFKDLPASDAWAVVLYSTSFSGGGAWGSGVTRNEAKRAARLQFARGFGSGGEDEFKETVYRRGPDGAWESEKS
jgi:hypothetical protein